MKPLDHDTTDRDELARLWWSYSIKAVNRANLPSWFDREQIALDGLASALLKWEPDRGPFQRCLDWYLRCAISIHRRYWSAGHRQHAQQWEDLFDDQLSADSTPPDSQAIRREQVAELIRSIPPRDRLVVVAIAFDGLTSAEIARANRVQRASVTQWLKRYRKRAAKVLDA